MKAYTLIALVLAAVTNVANADSFPSEKWNKQFAAEEVLFQALHVVDLGQTLDIKHHPDIQETNMSNGGSSDVIGHHPNDAKVVGWMITEAMVHFVVTDYLIRSDAPKWMVHGWEAVTIGVQAGVVHNNFSLGLRCKF